MSQKIASLVSLSHEDEPRMNLGEAAIYLSRSFFLSSEPFETLHQDNSYVFQPCRRKKVILNDVIGNNDAIFIVFAKDTSVKDFGVCKTIPFGIGFKERRGSIALESSIIDFLQRS